MSASTNALPLSAGLRRIARNLALVPTRLHAAATLSRSRKGLLALDDHLLRDVGLTRAQAQLEASRAAWDAPSHWKG